MNADYKIKGLFNQHLKIHLDENNVSNNDNAQVFGQILNGNFDSPAFSYLENLGFMRLHEVKSIGMYNELNLATKINERRDQEEILDESTVELPKKMVKVNKNILSVLQQRHSSRDFNEIPMRQADFSTIVKYSFGLSGRVMSYDGVKAYSRFYASGGGLYPINIILQVNNVSGIKPGLYRYQPYSHTLYPYQKCLDIRKFLQYGSFDFDDYSFIVLLEYDLNRNYLKYGELSLLTTMIEAGNISHNFELMCTAMDYSACQIAGFNKHYAEEVLGLDGLNSHILFTVICGKEK